MYIHEAVAEAIRIDGYMIYPGFHGMLRVKPTDTADCCIVEVKGKTPGPRWNPGARDLLADDWAVTKEGWI